MSNKSSNINKNNRIKKELRMIAVDRSNYDKLRELGHVPESFNTVVGRLIAEHYERASAVDNMIVVVGGSSSTK